MLDFSENQNAHHYIFTRELIELVALAMFPLCLAEGSTCFLDSIKPAGHSVNVDGRASR